MWSIQEPVNARTNKSVFLEKNLQEAALNLRLSLESLAKCTSISVQLSNKLHAKLIIVASVALKNRALAFVTSSASAFFAHPVSLGYNYDA